MATDGKDGNTLKLETLGPGGGLCLVLLLAILQNKLRVFVFPFTLDSY